MLTNSHDSNVPSEVLGEGNKLEIPDVSALSSIVPYLPSILLDTVSRNPNRPIPWIECLDGSLVLADVSGFTSMTEKLAQVGKEGAEWLTSIINDYFQRMLDTVSNYGGTNLRFGGDALLLLFRGDSHAVRAVAAASAMQRATRQFTTFHFGKYRVHLKMTVGVHSSSFYHAAVGLKEYPVQHLVLGSATNVVAKIQGLATTGELVISRETCDLIGDLCLTEPRSDGFVVLRLRKRPAGYHKGYPHVEGSGIQYNVTERLLSYLPSHIVQTLQSTGRIGVIEGEHRKVNIMFINLLGVDEILERFGKDCLVQELQRYVSVLSRLCGQYGGFIAGNDIYIDGFKIIVLFGAPTAHEKDASNALRLSLDLNHEIHELNLHLSHKIGINNGFVFAGDIGPSYRRQYTVMGDAVNLAARLMSACAPNQILVSRMVIDEAGLDFIVRELSPIKVKGKKDPVAVCCLEAECQTTDAGTTQPSKLFGREKETESFRKVCSEVEAKKGRCVTVSGEAGTGKTRLVQEFLLYLNTSHWTVYHTECYSHTMGRPFGPWVTILNSLFGIVSTSDTKARSKAVQSVIKEVNPSLLELASLLNPLLGISIMESNVTRSADEQTRRRLLFMLISGFIRSHAINSPVAIILEDLHWSDHSSLQLIEYLSRELTSSSLLICVTYRPEEGISLDLPKGSTITFALHELSRNAAVQLFGAILNCTTIPHHVAESIMAKAKGNPLFLGELARSIIRSGAVDTILSSPSFKLDSELASIGISDRVESLIMSRIDLLSTTAKALLRESAVIGSTFDFATLGALWENGPNDISLESGLRELLQSGLISQEVVQPAGQYRFTHTITQGIAYDSLPFSRRRKMHHRVASYIEDSHRNQLDMVYDVLEHHFRLSRDEKKIRFFALKAGDKARGVFAHEEAIEYYNHALVTLEVKLPEYLALRSYFVERIGDCYESSGRHKEAAQNFSAALREWQKTRSEFIIPEYLTSDLQEGTPLKVRKSALYHKIGMSLERNGAYDQALRKLELALNELPQRQPAIAAKITITKSQAFFHKGLYNEAIRYGRQGLILSRRTRNRGIIAFAHNIIANSYSCMGDFKKAMHHRHSAIRLYNELGDVPGQAIANNNLGACYQAIGNQDKALDCFIVSLEAAQRIGHLAYTAYAQNNMGEVFLIKGRYDEAKNVLQAVVETFEKHKDPAIYSLALINLSRVYQYQKDYDKALDLLNRGAKLAQKISARVLMIESLLQKAELQLDMDEIDLAQRNCKKALKDSRDSGMKVHEVRALRILGQIAQAKGKYALAETNLIESNTLAEGINADYERGMNLLALARLYAVCCNSGDTLLSQCYLRRAKVILKRMGAEAEVRRI